MFIACWDIINFKAEENKLMKLLLSGNSGQIAQAGNFNGISTRLEEQLKI